MSEANRAGKSDRAEIRDGKIEFGCSNFEGVLPFRREAQNCGTVKFLLKSLTIQSIGRPTKPKAEESYDAGAHRRPIQKAKRYIKNIRLGAHSH